MRGQDPVTQAEHGGDRRVDHQCVALEEQRVAEVRAQAIHKARSSGFRLVAGFGGALSPSCIRPSASDGAAASALPGGTSGIGT